MQTKSSLGCKISPATWSANLLWTPHSGT